MSAKRALLLGLVFAVSIAVAHGGLVTQSGVVQVISEPSYLTTLQVPFEGDIKEHTYVLHINGERDKYVILNPGEASLDTLKTGQYITVTGTTTASGNVSAPHLDPQGQPAEFQVQTIDTKATGGSRKLSQTATPIRATGALSALTVRVSVCGREPDYSLEQIRASIFNLGTPKDYFSGGSNIDHDLRYTYQDAYQRCSYNKGTINTASTFLYTGTIDICNDGAAWNLCSNANLPQVAAAAERILAERDLNPRTYDRIIMYLPAPDNCGIVGWGTVGCTRGTVCNVWIYRPSVSLVLHETSHNFGLNHAAAYGQYVGTRWREDEYGDRSGAMSLMHFTCFNAPNAWRLGWLSPMTTATASTLATGSPVRYTIPVQLSSDRSFVLVNMDWMTPATNFFISYRRQIGVYDQVQPLVYLHTASCSPTALARSSGDCMTNNTGMLAAGGLWFDTNTNLRVAVLSINETHANVQVCRSSSPCPGEPLRYITTPSRYYGYPSYRFFQGGGQVGHWDDSSLYSSFGPITQVTAFLRDVGPYQLIVGLQVSYGGVASDVRGDNSPDLQRSVFTLQDGERIISAAIRSSSGYFFTISFVTNTGRTGTVGDCSSADCQRLNSQTVTPPPYATSDPYLAAFIGTSNRYDNTDQLSFLVDLALWWTADNPGATANPTSPSSSTSRSPVLLPLGSPSPLTVNGRAPSPRRSPSPSPVPSPAPSGGYRLLTGNRFSWETPTSQRVIDESSLFNSNGPLTRINIISVASSDMTGAPSVVGLQATYGTRAGTQWGQAAGGAFTSSSLNLGSNEFITQIKLYNADGRSFDNTFDWIEGIEFTTDAGRTVGFGCVAGGQNQCSSSTSVTTSPPSNYSNAVVGALFGQALRTTAGYIISHFGFVWATN